MTTIEKLRAAIAEFDDEATVTMALGQLVICGKGDGDDLRRYADVAITGPLINVINSNGDVEEPNRFSMDVRVRVKPSVKKKARR